MDKRLDQIEKTRQNISRTCKWLSRTFHVFFIAYCLTVVVIAFFALFPLAGFSYVGPNNVILFVPIFCNIAAGGLAIMLIARMLRAIGKGESPFSLSSAQQIKALAIVLMVGVVTGALITPGTQVGSVSESGAMVLDFLGGSNDDMYTMHIDLKGLLISIICFALSPIFRYGALLQNEADDLM